VEGKIVFVPLSAPGDILDIEITADHGSFAEGSIKTVLEPSVDRVKPECPVFGSCGGCQWQHLSYETQLSWKKKILQESLERIAKIANPDVDDTLASPLHWNYRNRIQLHVSKTGKVGFHRTKSREIIEFDRCLIADDRINYELSERREEFRKRDRGISLRVEKGPAFIQVNTAQNEQVGKIIVDWMRSVAHSFVLELYAGAGNFTFQIAKIADRVVASDVDKNAISLAKKTALSLGAGNVEFIASHSAKAAGRMKGRCDAVFLDPPRKGAASALPDIVKLSPENIFYMSCDPATMARDVRFLSSSGYRFVKSLPIDMFPQTFHLESLTRLEKA